MRRHSLIHSFAHSLLLMLSALCVGCRQTVTYPDVLMQADSLTLCNADSALRLLLEIEEEMLQADEPTKRYYQLLTVKAQDKAYITHTSDSLILDVLHYYEQGGDVRLLPTAYYYAGRITSDLGDAPQAIGYFHHGLDAMQDKAYAQQMQGREKETYKQQGLMHAQMGYLFCRQHLYDEAIASLKQAYYIDSINQDTIGMLMSLCDIGQIHQSINQSDSALVCYKMAENFAKSIGDSLNLQSITLQVAFTYLDLGNVKDAKQKIDHLNYPIKRVNLQLFLLVKALYCNYVNQLDSAKCYFSRLEKIGTEAQKLQSKLWLADNAVKNNNPIEAVSFLNEHLTLLKSVYNLQNKEMLELVNASYNYQLREKENVRLTIENNRKRLLISATILIIVLIILWNLYIIWQNRINARKQRLKIQRLQEMKQENITILNQNRERIAILTQQLQNSKDHCNVLQDEITELLALSKQAELQDSFNSRWHSTKEYVLIQDKIQQCKPLEKEDWQHIEQMMTFINPLFITRLRAAYEFSEIEWQTSLLIKLNVSPTNIGILINRTTTAVSNIRQRLFKKVTQQEGSAKDWDKFILEL